MKSLGSNSYCTLEVLRKLNYKCLAQLRLPRCLNSKESTCNAGYAGSVPGLGRCPGEGNGNTHQYSCLENSMDRGAWWATVHRVTKGHDWSYWAEMWAPPQKFLVNWLDVGSAAAAAAAAAKSFQSYLTLCNPIDGSPPGSSVPWVLQARIPEWVAISCSNAWKWKVKAKLLSHVQLFTTPWTATYQAPPFMGFSRQEPWSGLRRRV